MDGLGQEHNAAFQQESADLVNQRGATLHQSIPDAVHGLYIKLLLGLDLRKTACSAWSRLRRLLPRPGSRSYSISDRVSRTGRESAAPDALVPAMQFPRSVHLRKPQGRRVMPADWRYRPRAVCGRTSCEPESYCALPMRPGERCSYQVDADGFNVHAMILVGCAEQRCYSAADHLISRLAALSVSDPLHPFYLE